MKELISKDWQKILEDEFSMKYWLQLEKKVDGAYKNSSVFPTRENIFNALALCPFDKVRVVILGQDPYHGERQAHGLAFSVPDGEKIPPSLRNIFKELESDTGKPIPSSGNLENWASSGVLLLNSTLTVEQGKAGSHQKFGWEKFTDAVIQELSNRRKNVVFLLWGAFAEQKESLIDSSKHLILKSTHPSPLSAYRGFLGSRHFSQANTYLEKHSIPKIPW
ncbi:uracil-DNA glycosylase [Candidatus Kaiserbacteria bacterium]|nr:uracil-DNA glycosylase [Candidatus Kaiserbacteria bacterium]